MNENGKKQFAEGEKVIAQVAEMGARRGTAWSYSLYEYDSKLKSGFRFVKKLTGWTPPTKANHKISLQLTDQWESEGYTVFIGRPSIEN